MNAVFLDINGLDDIDLRPIERVCDSLVTFSNTSQAEVLSRLDKADIAIVNKVKLTAEVLEKSTLRLICIVATGTNNVDLVAAKRLGIAVCNCQAYGVPSVVQHTFALMLALQTNLLNYDKAVQAGQWQKSEQFCFLDYPITELHDKSIGIIGYGSLGQGVAKIAQAFGMKVIIAKRDEQDTRAGRVSLSDLLPQVDVLSIHCPLTADTANLIDQIALKAMKPTAILINVARGGIVDEAALVSALKSGQIAGAATDVLLEEPPVSGNPLLDESLPNLIVTPHTAWGSKEARQRILNQTAENILSFVGGGDIRRII